MGGLLSLITTTYQIPISISVGDGMPPCCCGSGGGANCCGILMAFSRLIITGDIIGSPIGTPGGGWHGETDAPTKDYSVIDFAIYCVEGENGESGKFRITFSIDFSSEDCGSPTIDESFEQQLPCCPLNQTFNVPIPVGCDPSGVLNFTVSTPSDIPCPDE